MSLTIGTDVYQSMKCAGYAFLTERVLFVTMQDLEVDLVGSTIVFLSLITCKSSEKTRDMAYVQSNRVK